MTTRSRLFSLAPSRPLTWWAALMGFQVLACGPGPVAPPLVVTEVVREPPSVVPEPEPARVSDRVQDPEVYLADGFAERERRRAIMKRVGDVFWHIEAAEGGYVDLAAKPDMEPYDAEVIVAERHPRHLRVVREAGGLRATFYLATEDFHDLATRQVTLLTGGGEPFADGCGVTIPAGSRLEAKSPKVGYRRVGFRRSWVVAEGVLAERDVDVLYRLDVAPVGADDEGEECKIRAPFTLRDAPGGRTVAELVDEGLHFCTATGPARDGVRRIVFSHHGVRLVGYAPVARVQPRDPPMLGPLGTIGSLRGTALGWAASHTVYLYLSPGDAIFAAEPHLHIATVVEPDFKVGDSGEHDGWHHVRFPFQHWDFDLFHITPATASSARKRAEAIDRGR